MPNQPDPHPEWSGLLAAAQDGDRAAYAAFLQAAVPLLREAAQRSAHDSRSAEQVVQAALVSIHRLRHTYDPRRPVGPWLAGILAAHAPRARRRARPWRLNAILAPPSWSPFFAPRPT